MAGRSSTARWPRLPRSSPPRPAMPASKRSSSAPPVTRRKRANDLRPPLPPVSLDQEPHGDADQAAQAAQLPRGRQIGRALLLLVFLPHALRGAPAGTSLGVPRLAG